MWWEIIWVFIVLLPGLFFLTWQRILRGLDDRWKTCIIRSVSTLSVVVSFGTLIAEPVASVVYGFKEIPKYDPCPNIPWLLKYIVKDFTNLPRGITCVMVFRTINLFLPWSTTSLQILHRHIHNLPAGAPLWIAFSASYLMLIAEFIELYLVIFCAMCFMSVVHTSVSTLSSYCSMFSLYLELMNQTRENLKDEEVISFHSKWVVVVVDMIFIFLVGIT